MRNQSWMFSAQRCSSASISSGRSVLILTTLVALFSAISPPANASLIGDQVTVVGNPGLITESSVDITVVEGPELISDSNLGNVFRVVREVDIEQDTIRVGELVERIGSGGGSIFPISWRIENINWVEDPFSIITDVQIVSQTDTGAFLAGFDDISVTLGLGGGCTGFGCEPIPFFHSITVRLISSASTPSPVPAPAALWLFVSGLGLLGFLRRRNPGLGSWK